MTHIKHPYNWAKRELRSLGVRCTAEDNGGATYLLPDMTGTYVPRRVTGGGAVSILSDVRRRLGIYGSVHGGDNKPKPPPIQRSLLRVSVHAAERFALMQRQAQIGTPELEAALFYPEKVEPSHDTTFVYTTRRLSVVVVFDPDGRAVVKTITWADPAMFDIHPRPEKENAPVAAGAQ
jgi:hypothetical protein